MDLERHEERKPSAATVLAWEARAHMREYQESEPGSVHQMHEKSLANACFTDMTKLTFPMLHAGVMQRTAQDSDAAHEILQNTYERAYKALPKFRGDAEVSTWLFGIMLNELSRHYAKEAKRIRRHGELPANAFDEVVEPACLADPSELFDSSELPDDLSAALNALTPRRRRALLLRSMVGLSHAEVGEELGISEGAAKVTMHHAVRKMRESLSGKHKPIDIEADKL